MSYYNSETNQNFEVIAEEIMFRLMKTNEKFSKEDFYKQARNESMPPSFIQELYAEKVCEFEKVGYIKKTKDGFWIAAEEES